MREAEHDFPGSHRATEISARHGSSHGCSVGSGRWGYGKIETARLGAQCVQWILTRDKEHLIRLMHTRNYVPRQAAFCAEWLLFQELRRTKATLIYKRTGYLRAVQLLLGHTKIESAVRCLGIEVDDALAIAEQVDV